MAPLCRRGKSSGRLAFFYSRLLWEDRHLRHRRVDLLNPSVGRFTEGDHSIAFSNLNASICLHKPFCRKNLNASIDLLNLSPPRRFATRSQHRVPPPSKPERKAYMDKLAASPPNKKYWEAGGNCNTAIAAPRLGFQCVALGHVGDEIYGQFLLDVLRDEGIDMVGMNDELEYVNCSGVDYEMLLCWVRVDPFQRHGFCSRLDFTENPAFSWMDSLTGEVKTDIQRANILFVNGYGFDELSPGLIVSTLNYAATVGTCVFFDPGPRGKSLSNM